jgi:hypothetical protein
VPFLMKISPLRKSAWKMDRWMLRQFPSLEHFATGKVMSLRK